MSGYFKLIDAIDTSTTISVARNINNVTTYGYVRLEPGKKYELGDDSVFINSLKNAKIEKSFSAELVAKLKDNGIKYEEIVCRSCGGRVKKITYKIVEVFEE